MQADVGSLLATGTAAVVLAAAVLGVLLRTDLAAAGGGRLFLAGALGLGVLAFALKLVILLTLMTVPERTIAPLIAKAPAAAPPRTAPRAPKAPAAASPWAPLPDAASGGPAATPALVALGRRLFHDPALSADGTVACATCHALRGKAGADGRPRAVGVGGQVGPRNTPTVWNAAFLPRLFWDGRAPSLEAQAVGPLLNPREMAMPSTAAVEARVRADAAYGPLLVAAFGDGRATIDRVARALAAFERTLVTPDASFDRFLRGAGDALSAAQRRGMWLFRDLGCRQCHAGPAFAGPAEGPLRPFLAARSPTARARGLDAAVPPGSLWRVPSLRNVALTAPYFHDGSVPTLEEAVRVMAEAQLNALILAPGEMPPPAVVRWSAAEGRFTGRRRRVLTAGDIADLVAFLDSLTGPALASGGRR